MIDYISDFLRIIQLTLLFQYKYIIIIILIILVCILRYLQIYMITGVIGLLVVSIASNYIIGLTTYNILLLIPLAIMYATWNELHKDDDTDKINTIMKRIFWIMTIVQMIIIVYIYVRHNLFSRMSEVILWDYGITIEQIFTVEEKINYMDKYITIVTEYYKNNTKAKAYENIEIENRIASVQKIYKYMHSKINENEIREMVINALGNIRMHIIINEKDMRERIIKEISNVSVSDMKEYIIEIISKEYKDRLDKAMNNLKEEIQSLYKKRKKAIIIDNCGFFILSIIYTILFSDDTRPGNRLPDPREEVIRKVVKDIIKFIKDYLGL
jgi:hypothetical protein